MQRQVSFKEAIQIGFQKYATFDGRASRSEFWWWTLFGAIVGAACSIIDPAVLSSLASLALLLPNIAISIRRLHDIGRTGWWILIALTGIGAIVLLVFALQESKGANQYGDVPNLVD
jgi:uncharacterized membrane protein YhaH (DUF805 family)